MYTPHESYFSPTMYLLRPNEGCKSLWREDATRNSVGVRGEKALVELFPPTLQLALMLIQILIRDPGIYNIKFGDSVIKPKFGVWSGGRRKKIKKRYLEKRRET